MSSTRLRMPYFHNGNCGTFMRETAQRSFVKLSPVSLGGATTYGAYVEDPLACIVEAIVDKNGPAARSRQKKFRQEDSAPWIEPRQPGTARLRLKTL